MATERDWEGSGSWWKREVSCGPVAGVRCGLSDCWAMVSCSVTELVVSVGADESITVVVAVELLLVHFSWVVAEEELVP